MSTVNKHLDELRQGLAEMPTTGHTPNLWGFHEGLVKSGAAVYVQVTLDINIGALITKVSGDSLGVLGVTREELIGKRLADVQGAQENNNSVFERAERGFTVSKTWEFGGIKCLGLIFKERIRTYGEYLIRI